MFSRQGSRCEVSVDSKEADRGEPRSRRDRGQRLLARALGSGQGWIPLAPLVGFRGHTPSPWCWSPQGAPSVTLLLHRWQQVLLNSLAWAL